jgi:hypothetical protein
MTLQTAKSAGIPERHSSVRLPNAAGFVINQILLTGDTGNNGTDENSSVGRSPEFPKIACHSFVGLSPCFLRALAAELAE